MILALKSTITPLVIIMNFETKQDAQEWWETLKKDYKFVSKSLTDNTIIEMQQFIISEF